MSGTLTARAAPAESGLDARRWWALAVLSLATLMVVLDATIVNVALPSAQRDLGISDANRQWAITAYTLPFGGLLLLGGRIADFRGRKKIFMIALIAFAVASVIGGAAPNQGVLFAARALQGAFAALLAPAALSLINVTFIEKRERGIAFGIYGAVLGGGSAIGLLAGGTLTEYLDWRYCLYVNLPIAIVALIGAVPFVRESRIERQSRYDIPGSVLVTVGLGLLVYGCAEAVDNGWSSATTLGLLAGGVALCIAFVAVELRTESPLLPLRVVADRNRGGAFLASLLIFLAMMGMFLFLTYYIQGVLHYSAVKTGFAILPLTLVIMVGSGAVTGLMRVVAPRWIIAAAFLVCAAALIWFAQLESDSSFVSGLLGPEILVGLGISGILVPVTNLALLGIDDDDSGVASGLVTAAQQVGGSIGTALLNAVAAEVTVNFLTARNGARSAIVDATVHGYSVGFLVAAGIFAAGAVVSFLLINATAKDTSGSGLADAA